MNMQQLGFDNEKYLRIQSERIKERISHFEGKLYLEFITTAIPRSPTVIWNVDVMGITSD